MLNLTVTTGMNLQIHLTAVMTVISSKMISQEQTLISNISLIILKTETTVDLSKSEMTPRI